MRRFHIGLALAVTLLGFAAACGNDSGGGGGDQTGQACTAVSQCYPGVDQTTLQGTATCLTQVTGGYCTHTCTADSDCCAVQGECRTNFPEVCGPFESTGQTYCFLSCDSATLSNAGYTDETAFCQHFAGAAFTCRSTGGGAANEKICAP